LASVARPQHFRAAREEPPLAALPSEAVPPPALRRSALLLVSKHQSIEGLGADAILSQPLSLVPSSEFQWKAAISRLFLELTKN
jgi:hypothetical protein